MWILEMFRMLECSKSPKSLFDYKVKEKTGSYFTWTFKKHCDDAPDIFRFFVLKIVKMSCLMSPLLFLENYCLSYAYPSNQFLFL